MKKILQDFLDPNKLYISNNENYNEGKNLINAYFGDSYYSEFEKERRLKDIEVMHFLGKGIYLLGKQFEFLIRGKYNSELSQDEGITKIREYFQRVIELNTHDSNLYLALELALRIIKAVKREAEKALNNLSGITAIFSKYLNERAVFLSTLSKTLPATVREKLKESINPSKGAGEFFNAELLEKMNKMDEGLRDMVLKAKMMEMLRSDMYLVEEYTKNNQEYKKLIERKANHEFTKKLLENAYAFLLDKKLLVTGELIEKIIRENRSYAELLDKTFKEYHSEAQKWLESEEGIELLKLMERRDPMEFDKSWDYLKSLFTTYDDYKKQMIETIILREKELLEEAKREGTTIFKCKGCGKMLPPKYMRVLLEKEHVYCPNCGRIVNKLKKEPES